MITFSFDPGSATLLVSLVGRYMRELRKLLDGEDAPYYENEILSDHLGLVEKLYDEMSHQRVCGMQHEKIAPEGKRTIELERPEAQALYNLASNVLALVAQCRVPVPACDISALRSAAVKLKMQVEEQDMIAIFYEVLSEIDSCYEP